VGSVGGAGEDWEKGILVCELVGEICKDRERRGMGIVQTAHGGAC